MSGQDKANQNKKMAAMLKAQGVVRRRCRCPICHRVVQLEALPIHMLQLCGKGSGG